MRRPCTTVIGEESDEFGSGETRVGITQLGGKITERDDIS